jgi:hypothetical protein
MKTTTFKTIKSKSNNDNIIQTNRLRIQRQNHSNQSTQNPTTKSFKPINSESNNEITETINSETKKTKSHKPQQVRNPSNQ